MIDSLLLVIDVPRVRASTGRVHVERKQQEAGETFLPRRPT